jgi:hypothetical protein
MTINWAFIGGLSLIIGAVCKFFGSWGMLASGLVLVTIAILVEANS